MINKCVQPNTEDGRHYDVSVLAGPFDKISKAKKVSKALSEKEESSDDADLSENMLESPKQPSPKKRKLLGTKNNVTKTILLPKPPNSSVSNKFVSPCHNHSTKCTTNSLQKLQCDEPCISHSRNTPEKKEEVNAKSSLFKSPIADHVLHLYETQSMSNSTPREKIAEVIPVNGKNSLFKSPIADQVLNIDEIQSMPGSTSDDNIAESTPTKLIDPNSDIYHLTDFLIDAKSNDFIIENDDLLDTDVNSSENTGTLSSSELYYNEKCFKGILELQSNIIKIEKSNKAIQKQMLIQLTMLSNSNTKICKAIEILDKKLLVIMKADSRMRALALPIPALPPVFINILPAKTIDEVHTVESILSSEHSIDYMEELKSYLLIKVGSMSSLSAAIREAINCCFNYNVLNNFSYKGKTKKKFTDLKLFMVIYEALSGFRRTTFDEKQFHTVTDNYIRHAPKIILNTIQNE